MEHATLINSDVIMALTLDSGVNINKTLGASTITTNTTIEQLITSVRLFEQKLTPEYCQRCINHLKLVLKAIIRKKGDWSDH